MSLDRNTLESALAASLRDNFKKGKDEAWTADQAADAMAKAVADAVHAYASAARVSGVQTQVKDAGSNVIGTGHQTGDVALG